MKILLFNDNPVVTKLVTLSAQKTGDDLEVCSDTQNINSTKYDLIIVDDALYSDDNALELSAIDAKQHLFMLNRGSELPDGFEHKINKPFLPTDLVELFASISSSLDSHEEEHTADEIDSLDSDDLEIGDFADGLDMDLDAELESLDLDDFEDNLEDEELMQLDDKEELSSEIEDDDQDSVLDKDELAEVQSLLEDTDTKEDEDELILETLDDTDLGLAIDESDELSLDDGEIEIETEVEAEADNDLDDMDLGELEDDLQDDKSDNLKEDEQMNEQSDIDDFDLGDLEDALEDDGHEEIEDSQELDLGEFDDEELDGEELDLGELDNIQEDISLDTEDKETELEDEDMDELDLGELADEIESAVSELSDEDLQESVDEETLLDIVSNNETLDAFTELDDLDEMSLKVAVGEADADELQSSNESEIKTKEKTTDNTDKLDGVEALKTLLKALENDDVAKSLKGMNISINISFGDKK